MLATVQNSSSFIIDDLLLLIIDHLNDPADLGHCMLVNHQWHRIASSKLSKHIRFHHLKQRQSFFSLHLGPAPVDSSFQQTGYDVVHIQQCEGMDHSKNLNDSAVFLSLVREPSVIFSEPLTIQPILSVLNAHEQPDVTTHIVTQFRNLVTLDFGLDKQSTQQHLLLRRPNSTTGNAQSVIDDEEDSTVYPTEWKHHFISQDLQTLIHHFHLPNLTTLDLSKAQFFEPILQDLLIKFPTIKHLNLSFAGVKKQCLFAIATSGKNLVTLQLNGLFRLHRIPDTILIDIVQGCPNLKVLELKQSGIMDQDVLQECIALNPNLTILT